MNIVYLIGGLGRGGTEKQLYLNLKNLDHEKYKIEIFNSIGQKINEIYNGFPAIDQEIIVKWDGKDYNGMIVGSGTYFLLHTYNNEVKKFKFTIIK